MKISALLAATALLGATATFAADAPPDVLKSKGCLNCHAVDTKKVGPSFKDVAAKHKDNKNAVEDLTAKLKSGKGHPKVSASDDEIKTALTWVVKQK
jgi:cytochrome c